MLPRSHSARLLAFLAMLLTIGLPMAACGQKQQSKTEDPHEIARRELVRQLTRPLFGRTVIRDKRVLEAMGSVPRHRFVPEAWLGQAYADHPLPIGEGQTISQPYIVAIMTEALDLHKDDVVLEVGTGSGYQAAILAEIVSEVYTIEIVPELGKAAAKVLRDLEYKNVHTRIGDGYVGWKEHGPYDAIIVTAAPDHIPQPLVEQLKIGGRMVIPVGAQEEVQRLLLLTKQSSGKVQERVIDLVRFVPLTGENTKSR